MTEDRNERKGGKIFLIDMKLLDTKRITGELDKNYRGRKAGDFMCYVTSFHTFGVHTQKAHFKVFFFAPQKERKMENRKK